VPVTIRIPTQLRNLSDNNAEVQVEAGTVAEALKALEGAHPGFGERLFDDSGELRRFDEDIRFLQGIDTELAEGTTVSIVPAVAGG
jgi:molybdopterin synthase sulfur carrier subunit